MTPYRPAAVVLFLLVTGFLSGCAKHATPMTDEDLEATLERYRQADVREPGQPSIARKIELASEKVIEAHAAKARRARAQGWLLDAGAQWGKALTLCSRRVNPAACAEVAVLLKHDASALELSADEAAKQGRWEEACTAYDAILLVLPERVAVAEKNEAVQRAFADSLQGQAADLERRKLPGAAWAMNQRALRHDPMQDAAFQAGSMLEGSMRSHSKVAVQDVTVIDPKTAVKTTKKGKKKSGESAFAKNLGRSIRPRIDDVKPYGPTRDPGAVKATFTATIVSLETDDVTIEGVEQRANLDKTKLPNPEVAVQKKKIAGLQAAFTAMQKQKPSPKRARKLESAKSKLSAAKAVLAVMPAKIRPDKTWDLSWIETTRTVEATVRFELRESDFAEPLTLELTRRIERTDRTHRGDERHDVAADPLTLPTRESLLSDLAGSFVDGAGLLTAARDRRVKRGLDEGRAWLAVGRREQALDAFVEVMFLAGPAALDDDAAAFVARSIERADVRTLVASSR